MVAATLPPRAPSYPVHVDAERPVTLSRWLWLVKWVLAIPHYVILALLWAAFAVLSVVALVAIVVTGRYPRSIFEFNVGVLRWTWRVVYYSYGALATDRYPPFTLAEVDDYPAHLHVDHPEHLSRGLALVKWWLLALPHYVVVGLLVSGGVTVVRWTSENARWVDGGARWDGWEWNGGLIGILVLVAGVVVLVTGVYPRGLYDLILGLNRWVIRVAAYAGLMTDVYPPFRLDMGEHDGATLYAGPAPTGPPASGPAPARPGPGGPAPRAGWTDGRVVAAVLGALLAVVGLGGLGAGATLGFGQVFLREDGFVTTPTRHITSERYAVVLEDVEVHADGLPLDWPRRLLGDVRVRAAAADGGEIFLGIAAADDVAAYLDGVGHHTMTDRGGLRRHDGGAPVLAPTDAGIWLVAAAGSGTQELRTELVDGSWAVVLMDPDGSAGIDAAVDVGATVPWLPGVTVALLVVGLGCVVVGAVIIVAAARRAVGGTGERAVS